MKAYGRYFLPPSIEVPGDNVERIMHRSGEITALSKTRAVWRFGFLEKSEAGTAYGVTLPFFGFLWVLSTPTGRILGTFNGIAFELPKRFRKIGGAR